MKKSLACGTAIVLLTAIVSGVMLSQENSPDQGISEASRAITGRSDDREVHAQRVEEVARASSNVDSRSVLPEDRKTRPGAYAGSSSAASAGVVSGGRNENTDLASLTPQESDGDTGESVEVGRPFPVPLSIRDICEDGPGHVCAVVFPHIDKMGAERRDPVWAPQAEGRLLKLLGSAPGQFVVRNLECRTSLCVAEVASSEGPHPGIGGYRIEVDNGLYSLGVLTAYEESEQGMKVAVRLFVYERRGLRRGAPSRD